MRRKPNVFAYWHVISARFAGVDGGGGAFCCSLQFRIDGLGPIECRAHSGTIELTRCCKRRLLLGTKATFSWYDWMQLSGVVAFIVAAQLVVFGADAVSINISLYFFVTDFCAKMLLLIR